MENISLAQVALGDVEHEFSLTRRALQSVVDEHLGWRPHEKSFTLGALAQHVANLASWITQMLQEDGIDLATLLPSSTLLETSDEIRELFEANAAKVRSLLSRADNLTLGRAYTLRMGDHVISTMPKFAMIRSMGISHMIHHRAQLTVYFRLLNLPVPGLYGPSADEKQL